jgi:hypothetical protein
MKRKNSTLKNKLRNYSLLSGSLLAAGAANGQIIYHAVNPNIVLDTNGATYNLDLNGDGDTDFVFKEIVGTDNIKAAVLFHNQSASMAGSVVKTSGKRYGYPFVFSEGNKIGASAVWFNNSAIKHGAHYYPPVLAGSYANGGVIYGNWKSGETGEYLGLRIKIINVDTVSYYGWARCSVTKGGKSITISGYAFQSIPDSSINAGDTDVIMPAGIKNQTLKNLNVYSSGKNVFVKYPGVANDGMTIIVRDLLGREIVAKQTNNELYELYLQNAASGIYTVTVQSKGSEITKKVSIQ